jgi:hypothetical protein
MHGILCISGKLRRPWTCDLAAHYFCHLFQDGSVFFLFFLNFHFFAKVWSLKLLAKNFARDVNALAKVFQLKLLFVIRHVFCKLYICSRL